MSEAQVRDPDIGDVVTVVVVHPNKDSDRDPAAKLGGKTAYIRAEDQYSFEPEFGETIQATVADVQEHNYLLLVGDEE